jgi:hypothetical protein
LVHDDRARDESQPEDDSITMPPDNPSDDLLPVTTAPSHLRRDEEIRRPNPRYVDSISVEKGINPTAREAMVDELNILSM